MITPGDLVVVVSKHCSCVRSHKHIGKVFKVTQIMQDFGICTDCFRRHPSMALADSGNGWYPVNTLKRIPPLPELETQRNEEELTV